MIVPGVGELKDNFKGEESFPMMQSAFHQDLPRQLKVHSDEVRLDPVEFG